MSTDLTKKTSSLKGNGHYCSGRHTCLLLRDECPMCSVFAYDYYLISACRCQSHTGWVACHVDVGEEG